MKKNKIAILALLMAVTVFSGCSTTISSLKEQPVKIREFNRDEYVILDKVEGVSKSFKLWLLFIPFGGKTDQMLYDQAYSTAVKSAVGQQADGLLQPHYTYKRTTVPLIIFGFTTKKVVAEGKAFRLKTEEEYKQTKENN